MSFNDLAKKEAADKKALQEKETQSSAIADEGPVMRTKPIDPPPD